jgi:hypothetical protein
MLRKCANPACIVRFRKLGSGKLFAFESVTIAGSVDSSSRGITTARNPVFFWLCECCSLSFTMELDAAGQLALQRIPDGAHVTIFDGLSLNHAE